MKPISLGVTILSAAFLVSVPASAQTAPAPRPYAGHFSNRILDDVVRMTHAGISDDSIIAYVRARMPRLAQDLHPEDLGSLQQAGVSENVVRFIADAAGQNGGTRGIRGDVQAGYGDTVPVDPGAYGYGGYPAYGYGYGYPAYGYGYGYPAYGYPYWAYWGYPYYGYAYWPWWGWGWHGGHGHVAHFHGGHFHGGHFHGGHVIHHGGGGHGHGGGGHGHGGHR